MKKNSKKVSQCRKNERGDPLVSPGIACYAEKEEKSLWCSSLGQMIEFGIIKFRRTFKNYFGQFVWIEKKSLKIDPIVHLGLILATFNSTNIPSAGSADFNRGRFCSN